MLFEYLLSLSPAKCVKAEDGFILLYAKYQIPLPKASWYVTQGIEVRNIL